MDIYRDTILDHYKHPRNHGELPHPTHEARDENTSCGDTIRITLVVEDGMVREVRFEGDGCAISQASASLLTERITTMSVDDIMNLSTEDILAMVGTTLTPTRVKCAVLPLEVLHAALSTDSS